MVEQLSSAELTELYAFADMEPMGEWRADLRMGVLAQQIWRVNLGRGQKAPAPLDFMPFEQKAEPAEDPKRLGDRIVSFFKGVAGRARS